MSLDPGTRVGVYEIAAQIGAGGMGEVYRATDTKLKRQVAIKVLPASLGASGDRLARFQREAELLASLNHPCIAGIYGLEESGDTTAIVMELVDGEDLSQRIASGPIPIDEAIAIAKQIADALAAAHAQGIIHRDLKPANIKLRADGTVKVLDFGLAKALAPEPAASGAANRSQSPTITSPALLTNVGIVLGTAAYMSPEQAKGLEADKRSDVWAFGCVLFEMLTARRPFDGEDMADVLGAVVRLEPPWEALPSDVPAPVRTLLRQCLVKDRRGRIGDIAAAQFVLDHQIGTPSTPSASPASSARVAWTIAAVSVIALIGSVAWPQWSRPQATAPEQIRFTIAPPNGTTFGGPLAGGTGNNTQLAISPDGRHIAFVAGGATGFTLWVRPIGGAEARQLTGTDGAAFPFWSPDSQNIAFFSGNQLKKVSSSGGPVIVLADAPLAMGGSWSRDNVILVGFTRAPISRVSSAGGPLTPLTSIVQGEDAHRWPHFLPDGQHFLYTAVVGTCCPAAVPGTVKISSLGAKEPPSTLFVADSAVTFRSGHLLFAREETMMAQAFDPSTRQLIGEAVPVIDSVGQEGSRYISASVSDNGTMVYAPAVSQNPQQLIWYDRTGKALGTLGAGASDANIALSPDEKQVALAVRTGTPFNLDVWTIDVARNLRNRVTIDPESQGWPVWSPDGKRIVFGVLSRLQGDQVAPGLAQTALEASAAHETVLDGTAIARDCAPGQCMLTPTDYSRDGRHLLFTFNGTFPARLDVWAMPMAGDRKPFAIAQTRFRESLATFSPDGRWIAYMSDEAGELNVYVQPFLREGGKYRISPSGGRNPHWRADGKELFYLDSIGTMTSVSIDTANGFSAGLPKTLFPTGIIGMSQMYVVTKDGQRFLVNGRPRSDAAAAAPITVVVNWTPTLTAR